MLQRHGFSCYLVLVQCLAVIVPSSAYFQTPFGGYVFSIPRFIDAEKRNQVNAQAWCNGYQSKLLEITSDKVQSSIVSFINYAISLNQMSANNVITNGKRFNSALTWVNGVAYSSSVSVKGQEPGFTNSYGYLNSTQSRFDFFVDSPISTRGYICEGSSFCTSGFTTNGRCYKSFSEQLSWYDAQNRCTDGKGDLASFDFIVDNNGFSALNGSGWNPPSSYWIGFRRQLWKWQLSNSDVVYSQWSRGHPDYSTNQNYSCLCLLPNYPTYDWKWSECDCTQTFQFVCMTEAPSSTASSTANRVVLTSTTTDASRAASTSMTPAISVLSDTSSNRVLAVGLGVGLGVGIPVAIIILILAFVIVRQRRKIKSSETNRNVSFNGTPMESKAGNATTYESLKENGQRGDTSTYEELSTGANRQNSET